MILAIDFCKDPRQLWPDPKEQHIGHGLIHSCLARATTISISITITTKIENELSIRQDLSKMQQPHEDASTLSLRMHRFS
jgi:hypothetical protein